MYALDESDILPCQLYSAQQVKSGELACAEITGTSLYQLMEQAGHAVFEATLAHFNQASRIVVLAGRGNNGGDAYVFARLALQAKCQVRVFSQHPDKPLQGDAEIARKAYINQGCAVEEMSRVDYQGAELIVDGLIGTGFKGEMREDIAKVIKAANAAEALTLAIDLPSGLNADTGIASEHCIEADYTVTFIAAKVGLMIADGPDHSGCVLFAGLTIGDLFAQTYAPLAHIFGLSTQTIINKRKRNTNKGKNGHILCIGGGEGMPGAIYLASKAGLRSGAGKASVICHSSNIGTVNAMCPELMVWGYQSAQNDTLKQKIHSADVVVLGPGLGQSKWSEMLVEAVFAILQIKAKPLVIDADGLNLIAQNESLKQMFLRCHCPSVLTPHPLEAARLLQQTVTEVNHNRIECASLLAQTTGSHIVLKGNHSLVADGQQVSVNLTGNSGMASAGMGDVLTGIIAALLGNKENLQINLNERVKLAVYLHGLAGDFAAKSGEIGIIASDVIEQLPAAIESCIQ